MLACIRCWHPLVTSVSAQLLWACWLRSLSCTPSSTGLIEMVLTTCWCFSLVVSQLPCQLSCLWPWLLDLIACPNKELSPREWRPLKKWQGWMFSAVTKPELSPLISLLLTRAWLRLVLVTHLEDFICTKYDDEIIPLINYRPLIFRFSKMHSNKMHRIFKKLFLWLMIFIYLLHHNY